VIHSVELYYETVCYVCRERERENSWNFVLPEWITLTWWGGLLHQ
jgi:hypothetical protein